MPIRRESKDVLANDSARLLADPIFQRCIAEVEKEIVVLIANAKSDGGEVFEATQSELCRELRVLTRLKRNLLSKTGMQELRDAGFAPVNSGNKKEG